MKTIQTTVKVQTSPGVLWKAITDHHALPRHISMLREVKVVVAKENGVGTVRQFILSGGTSFHEKITGWEEGVATVSPPIWRSITPKCY